MLYLSTPAPSHTAPGETVSNRLHAQQGDSIGTQLLGPIAARRAPALAAVVEERLRDAIMFGHLALGEAISEDRLATMLGVSRTPVREALTALQLQGVVTIQPQRGSFVFQPTDENLAEICDYRLFIESHAMSLSVRRARAETIVKLEAAQVAMEAAEAAGDMEAAARADAAFHNAFIEQCGNSLLVQAYTLVSGQVGAIRFFARRSSGTRNHSGSQHRAIISALAAGDAKQAQKVLCEHVMNMKAHFAEAMVAAENAGSADAAS